MRWQSFNAVLVLFTIKGAICLRPFSRYLTFNFKHAKLQTSRFYFAQTVAVHVKHNPKAVEHGDDDQARFIRLNYPVPIF